MFKFGTKLERALCLLESDDTVTHLRSALYGIDGGGDSAIVWYNPDRRQAFVSVGDWASPERWVRAITPVVDDVETTHEGGPDGDGWLVVRDYHRIKDSFGMTPERRLEVGLDRPVVEAIIRSKLLHESDYFDHSTFSIGDDEFVVNKTAKWAAQTHKTSRVSVRRLVRELFACGDDCFDEPVGSSGWKDRANQASLDYPILIVRDGSSLRVGDGNHRLWLAYKSGRRYINAYIVDADDIPDECMVNAVQSEGVVAAARGQITTVVNDIAGRVARSAEEIFGNDRVLKSVLNFDRPQVEFADEEDEPAVVLLRLGARTPETISVTVFGDGGGEIKLEMSERLAGLLELPQHAVLSSSKEAAQKLVEVAAIMRRKLGQGRETNNVDRTDRAEVGGSGDEQNYGPRV